MNRMLTALVLIILTMGPASAEESNLAGGVMIAHHPAGLVYTGDDIDWCGVYAGAPLTDATDQNNMIIGNIGEAAVWYVVVAFVEDKVWCGIDFGFGDYNADNFYIDGYGPCLSDNLELSTGGWPGPNEGTAVVATSTLWAGNYQAIYWFGGICYGETVIPLDVDPYTDEIALCNCSAPPVAWDAQGGAMGIFTEGVAVYPEWQGLPQACCDLFGVCELLIPSDCQAVGGIVDPAETCDPNPCAVLVRACCMENGECVLLLPADCNLIGGAPEDEIETCDPNPCEITATDDTSWGKMKSMFR